MLTASLLAVCPAAPTPGSSDARSRVVLLTNFLPPHQLPLMREIQARIGGFSIYVSTPMEPNRRWQPAWQGLRVRVQHSWTIVRKWKHPDGFVEGNYVHIPYDTLVVLRRDRPDVVISSELGARTILAAAYARVYRKRLLTWATISESTERGRSALRTSIRRILIHLSDGVIVNGRSGEDYIRSLVPKARVYQIPRPVDFEAFSTTGVRRSPASRHTLLYVGSLSHRKGILPFIRALGRWAHAHPDRHVRMHVVGYGPLESEIAALRLPANVSLQRSEHVPYERVPPLYEEAGALTLPTIADEWGMVVGEALASGIPVLGSVASQAVTELIEDGVTGWRFDPLDPSSIEVAIDRFFSTPPERLEEMGAHGRRVAEGLGSRAVAQMFMNAIRDQLLAQAGVNGDSQGGALT
jgi:glycosyltransferase involved in cell wall biosynthesis